MIQRGIVIRPLLKPIGRCVNRASPTTSLTLDLIATQPAAAYGMRKLRSAYNGSCLRIRRSSDNAEQDIGFVGTSLDTASIASFIGGGTGFIRTWYDQGANANHLVQSADATKQPTYSSSTAVFDGANDVLSMTSSISQTSGYTIFTNLQASDTAGTKGIVASNNVAGALYLRIGATEQYVIVRQSQATLLAGSSTGITSKTVTRWRSFSTGNSIHVNGVSEGSNATDNALTQPISIVGGASTSLSDPFAGPMQEILIYTADISNADSNLLGNNMATFAGTSWTNI